MQIMGHVRNQAGNPIVGALVEGRDPTKKVIDRAVTDDNGNYELDGQGMIDLWVLPPNWGTQASSVGYLPHIHRIEGVPRPDRANIDIDLIQAIPLRILAFDTNGEQLTKPTPEHLRLLNPKYVIIRDLDLRPAFGTIHWGQADDCPTLLLPAEEPRVISLLWTAPGYGRVLCHADNQGQGFSAGFSSTEIHLNVALAESAWQRLSREVAKCEQDQYELSAAFAEQWELAREQVESMRQSTSAQAMAHHADLALGLCLTAGEILTMERAEQRIQRYRNRRFLVRIKDGQGQDQAGCRVQFSQTQHDFHFGMFISPDTHPIDRIPLESHIIWDRLRQMGINQLSLPLLWSQLEPKPGGRHDEAVYERWPADKLQAAGFRLKDHISVWFWQGEYPHQWGAFAPDWLYDASFDEILDAVKNHKHEVVKKYYPHVEGWQAINEAMLSHTNCYNLDLEQTIAIVKEVVSIIRETAGGAPIEVNNCQVFGEEISPALRAQGYEMVPDEFYEALLKHDIDFDAVGMQLYYGGYLKSDLFSGGFAIRHPWDIEDVVNRYSRLGKPIYITEISIPSSYPAPEDNLDIGYWHKPWTPEQQAEWVKLIYTLYYSLPQVQEISWWNAVDEGAFVKDGGLLWEDYSPKPAGEALGNLTSSWLSKGEAMVTESGIATISGPAGRYQITVLKGDEVVGTGEVYLEPGQYEPLTVTICQE
jgi:GH35 family endo-1,4-beta-xylanase